MYKLRNGVKNGFGTKPKTSEKRQKGVNLYIYQWNLLDRIAEETGKSRNQALRDLLEDYFSEEDRFTDFQEDIAISVLEHIYVEATESELKQAVNRVEKEVMDLDQY